MTERIETQVLIIGGGVTGAGLARDLSLRGVDCVLVERHEAAAGASGANHGLLHSGGRYIVSDPATALECRDESRLLKRLAPSCIEDCGGLFVALPGDDEGYPAAFFEKCTAHGLPCRPVEPSLAREMEPGLAREATAVYAVEDGSVNPFKLTLDNLLDAQSRGARVFMQAGVEGMRRRGRRVSEVFLRLKGREVQVEAGQVVNAAGTWVGRVAAMASVKLPMVYSKGTLLISITRLAGRVLNRLRPPGDGDIIVPGGTVSVLGTTSVRVEDPDHLTITMPEVDLLVEEGARLWPGLQETRFIRAYAGVRPLMAESQGEGGDRDIKRGFVLLDHEDHGLENFISITGGKMTTYRLMAEKTADLVCRRLGANSPCLTAKEPLPAPPATAWLEPYHLRRQWLASHDPKDVLLCECEMVPASAVDQIADGLLAQGDPLSLRGVFLRSRMGRGTCQGAFCSHRLVAHWYEQGLLGDAEGLKLVRDFFESRWRGTRPVLWGGQLAQSQLQEAICFGLMGLEL